MVFTRCSHLKHGVSEDCLQVLRAGRPPNPITAIVPARGHPGDVANAEGNLGGAIRVNRVVTNMGVLVAKPVGHFGHWTLAFARGTGIESVEEGDGIGKHGLESQAHGGLSHRVDASCIPERAELGGTAVEEHQQDPEEEGSEKGPGMLVGSH